MKTLPVMLIFCLLAASVDAIAPANASSAPEAVLQSKKEPKKDYISELIRTILEKTDAPDAAARKSVPSKKISRDRLLLELISGEQIEYTAKATQPRWEEELIAIRIPLRKGLQGYRLFLINSKDQEEFASINTLDEIIKLPTGLSLQWSITPILRLAGFNLVGGASKAELAKMLSLGRFKFFARGVDEAYKEHGKYVENHPNLVVEETLALQIRHPVYLFVTPKRPDLAQRFERGLRIMLEDGSFDELFWEHFRKDVEAAQLHTRKVFSVPNPYLTKETPLDDARLWLDPTMPPPPVKDALSDLSPAD